MIDTTSAKAWMKVETNAEDTLIGSLVTAAVAHIESVTGKYMTPKAFTQQLRGFPSGYPYAVKLNRGPVTAIAEIAYDAADGSGEATVGDFRLTEGYGTTFNGELQPAYGESWPSTLDGAGVVRISGTAGYADVAAEAPELDQAAHMLVAHWYQNREAASSANVTEIPLGVQALLGPYRPVGLA